MAITAFQNAFMKFEFHVIAHTIDASAKSALISKMTEIHVHTQVDSFSTCNMCIYTYSYENSSSASSRQSRSRRDTGVAIEARSLSILNSAHNASRNMASAVARMRGDKWKERIN